MRTSRRRSSAETLSHLAGERSIASIISAEFGLDPEEVIAMITCKPRSHASASRRFVATIISSGVDADKADYLERDSIHMGVSYGRNYDRARFPGRPVRQHRR